MLDTIEFYQIGISNSLGKLNQYQGAVVFGPRRRFGCELLAILTPMPTTDSLHEQLSRLHHAALKPRIIFLDWNRQTVVKLIQQYCHEGMPLPNIFDTSIARITGFTDFQALCYQETTKIPHGETKSYGWLAASLRKPQGQRAVGRAMRTNPFPLIIPCHRVVKSDGNLGGYMGITNQNSWELELKKSLLDIENMYQQPTLFPVYPIYEDQTKVILNSPLQ